MLFVFSSIDFCAGAMDAYSRGLKNAARLIDDGILEKLVKERYSSFSSGIGQRIHNVSIKN